MTTKYYTNRDDLYDDMEFIYDLRIPYNVKQQLLDELFESWKYHSPDSPWFKRPNNSKEEIDAAETLVKISEGISNEWKGEHIVFEHVNGTRKKSKKRGRRHTYNLRSR
jgi:hypothetical protein